MKYFVSYRWWSNSECGQGAGCCEVTRVKPVCGMSDINEMADAIRKNSAVLKEGDDVVVMNWQRFEEPIETVEVKDELT